MRPNNWRRIPKKGKVEPNNCQQLVGTPALRDFKVTARRGRGLVGGANGKQKSPKLTETNITKCI